MRYIPAYLLFFLIVVSVSCKHEPFAAPGPGDSTLCFERDILPIFISECAKSGCHDAKKHEEGYVLDSYIHIMQKGIKPRNADGSKIYQSITGKTEERMPQGTPPLSNEKIALIKQWIDAGAAQDNNCSTACDSNNLAYTAGIKPLADKYCSGCHSGAAAQGNLLLTSYSQIKSAVENNHLLNSIRYEAGYPGMPQGLHLSDCEVKQFEKWVSAGMPDN